VVSNTRSPADLGEADQQPRPFDEACVNGITETGICTPSVPDRRHSKLKSSLQVWDCFLESIRRRNVVDSRESVKGHLCVTVDQTWKQCEPRTVHLNIAIQIMPYVDNSIPIESDVRRLCLS
jgi:hypothetical protein